jgi:hypothetical protein
MVHWPICFHLSSEFEVESVQFPGQKHVWRLASWLQLGSVRSNDALLDNLSTSLSLLYNAKNRVFSDRLSIKQGVKSIYRGTTRLVDMLIGLPAFQDNNDESWDNEAEHLVAELTVDVRDEFKYKRFITRFKEDFKNVQLGVPEEKRVRIQALEKL